MMSDILQISKNVGMRHNVTLRVMDANTHRVISCHEGHNAATNSMLLGIAHYLTGEGILNQSRYTLSQYIPMYISLGTMGLCTQDHDRYGLPTGVGQTVYDDEETRFTDYMDQIPGFGADGYSAQKNNNRLAFGLGPMFEDRLGGVAIPGEVDTEESYKTCGRQCLTDGICENCSYYHVVHDKLWVPDTRRSVGCELVSNRLGQWRSAISYRDVVPERQAELSQTVDVIFSTLISTGQLAMFREPGKDYIFITEAGLWSRRDWITGGENGLLAAYRIAPPDEQNWDMSVPSNRDIVKRNILRVGKNEVVQVIWKIQIGALEQLTSTLGGRGKLRWIIWDDKAKAFYNKLLQSK